MRKLLPSLFFVAFFLFVFPTQIWAADASLEQTLNQWSINLVILTTVIAAIVFLLIFLTKNKESLKIFFFLGIIVPVIVTSLFLAGSTVYVNQVSETKGPVHWHADFEIYNCGQKIDLVDPVGFSNKIGTPTFHEHNDGRVHVEGVVLEMEDVSFNSFMEVIGGKITDFGLEFPTTEGSLVLNNGDTCPDGYEGEWNVFLFSVAGKSINREKLNLEELKEHILAPEGSVPPGDCIIMEFTESKRHTDKLCNFYKTAIQQGKFSY